MWKKIKDGLFVAGLFFAAFCLLIFRMCKKHPKRSVIVIGFGAAIIAAFSGAAIPVLAILGITFFTLFALEMYGSISKSLANLFINKVEGKSDDKRKAQTQSYDNQDKEYSPSTLAREDRYYSVDLNNHEDEAKDYVNSFNSDKGVKNKSQVVSNKVLEEAKVVRSKWRQKNSINPNGLK